jgi:hypothetical protein
MMRLPERPFTLLALLGIALALAVGHANGNDGEGEAGPVAMPVDRAGAAAGTPAASAGPALAFNRPRRAAGEEPVADLFTGRSWVPPPPPAPVAAPAPPPEPTAPALPFAYIGMMESEDAKPVVYLSRGERLLAVSEGDVIDQVYRIQSLSTHRIVLVYLPLGKEQALAIGSDRP